jgi:hypothetical protein
VVEARKVTGPSGATVEVRGNTRGGCWWGDRGGESRL